MIQPRPVRSCPSKDSTSLSAAAFAAAVCVWFGVKLAGPSSEGSSVEQCRLT